MSEPRKVVWLAQTCGGCPAQWEGQIEDGRVLYVRYRYGRLTIQQSAQPSDDLLDAVGGEFLMDESTGGEWDGWMEEAEMLRYLERVGLTFRREVA